MPWFDFRWVFYNRVKIANHGVTTDDCEWVVSHTTPTRSGEKFIADGRTQAGQRIRVVYVKDDPLTVFVITAYRL